MSSVHTRSDSSSLALPSLFFVYSLLSTLGFFFASSFFADTLEGDAPSARLAVAAFIGIAAILFLFLLFLLLHLIRDILKKRAGAHLRARLLGYFTVAAILSVLPVTIITSRFVTETLESWYSSGLEAAVSDARWFALDSYRYRMAVLERIAEKSDLDEVVTKASAGDASGALSLLRKEDPALAALEEFTLEDGLWTSSLYSGESPLRLTAPPTGERGFLPRLSSGAPDLIRYCIPLGGKRLRVLSFELGTNFDKRLERIETAVARNESLEDVKASLSRGLLLLYAAFSLPSLLMAIIIAFSLSAAFTLPLVHLAEATRRVAEGDFSIRLLARSGDELGSLIQSFNAMVRDLETSRMMSLRAEKINVWQDMAQRLAHEIKNPLTPIRLSAERVLRRYRNDPDRLGEILEDCMKGIVQEVDGLNQMLSEFKSFSRLPPPNTSVESLYELVDEAVALYRSSYPGVDFRFDSIPTDLSLLADRRQIGQVLANLTINAIDAMNGRGTIEFRADLVKKRDTRYCRLSVRDTGKGVDEASRAHLFDPYFTTKDKGTGLGLSIVERIVTDHGGMVWFDSAEGAGTIFYLDLPAAPAFTAPSEPRKPHERHSDY